MHRRKLLVTSSDRLLTMLLVPIVLTTFTLTGCIEERSPEQVTSEEDNLDTGLLVGAQDTDSERIDQNTLGADQDFSENCDPDSNEVDCENPLCSNHPSCIEETLCPQGISVELELSELYEIDLATADDWDQGSCGGDGPESLFSYTPSEDGEFCINTAGSEGDTVLYVRTDCANPDSELACNDDSEDFTAMLSIELSAMTNYYIYVD